MTEPLDHLRAMLERLRNGDTDQPPWAMLALLDQGQRDNAAAQRSLREQGDQQVRDIREALDDLRRYVATQDGTRTRTLEMIDECRRAAGCKSADVESGR